MRRVSFVITCSFLYASAALSSTPTLCILLRLICALAILLLDPQALSHSSLAKLADWKALDAGARAAADDEDVGPRLTAPSAWVFHHGVAGRALDEEHVAVPADGALDLGALAYQQLEGDGAHVGEEAPGHVLQGPALVCCGSPRRGSFPCRCGRTWVLWSAGCVLRATVGVVGLAIGRAATMWPQGSGRQERSGLVEV